MATWNDFTAYVKANFKVQKDDGNVLVLTFDVGEGRSQIVVIQRAALMNGAEEWAVLNSPVGPAAKVDLAKALAKVGNMVVGGLAMEGDIVVLKHPIPLTNLDTNEFMRPLHLLLGSADDLEEELVGGDRF
jgi:hypothetical protein